MGTRDSLPRCLLLILASVAFLLGRGGQPSRSYRNVILIHHNSRHTELSHSLNVICVFVLFFMLHCVLFMSVIFDVRVQKTSICTHAKQLWMSYDFRHETFLHHLLSYDKRTTFDLQQSSQHRYVMKGHFHSIVESGRDEAFCNYLSNNTYLPCASTTAHCVSCDADHHGNMLSHINQLLLRGFIRDSYCEQQVVLDANHIRWGSFGNIHAGMGSRHFKGSSLHCIIHRVFSISPYGEEHCRKSFTSTTFGHTVKYPVSIYDIIIVDTRCRYPTADFDVVAFNATRRFRPTQSSNKRIARKFDATEIPSKHGREQAWVVRPVTQFLPDATNNPSVDLAHVGYRLATLSALPPSVPGSRIRFADAGFFFRGQGDELICYKCQVRHSGWTLEDNPLEVHRRISPNCPHVTERSRELSATAAYLGNANNDNEQQRSSSSFRTASAGGNAVVSISAGLSSLSTDEPQEGMNCGSQRQQIAGAYTAPRITGNRQTSNSETLQASVPTGASSFASFTPAGVLTPVQTSQGSAAGLRPEHPQEAKALFKQPTVDASYAGVVGGTGGGMSDGCSSVIMSESRLGGGDSNRNAGVRAGSGVGGRSSNASGKAGAMASSSGPRMGLLGGAPSVSTQSIHENSRAGSNASRTGLTSNQHNSRSSAESGGSAQGGGTGGQRGGAANMFPRAALDLGGSVYPMYQDMASRRRSFASWDETHAPPLDQIILCGMFYAGYADCVRCFYCGVGLKHFEATDDIWAEHIRWRPTCGYVRAVKGDDFIRRTQARLARESGHEEDSELDNGGGNAQAPANSGPFAPGGLPSRLPGQRGTTPALPVTRQSIASVTSPLPASVTTSASQSTTQLPVATATVTSEPAAVTSASTAMSSPPVPATASAGVATTSNAASTETSSRRQASSTVPERLVEASSVVAQNDETHAQRVARLQAENRELARRLRCKVCHREPIDTILMPCGHLVACEACARVITQCPLCHGQIRATAKVHMN